MHPSIESKFVYTTVQESIVEKDWAAGTSKQMDFNEYIIHADGSASYSAVRYAPAWLKTIDEPIVNALDHLVSAGEPPFTELFVEFSKEGKIRIYNNGAGIPVIIHTVATEKLGQETWLPTLLFGTAFQGSNRVKTPDSIVGGTNGLGAKISNYFSSLFMMETVDATTYFAQVWRNNAKIVEPPIILPHNHPKIPPHKKTQHTTVNFSPDYTKFGYPAFTESDYLNLVDIVRTRVIFACIYANLVSKNVTVKFNGLKITIKTTSQLAGVLFPTAACLTTTIHPPASLPWELTIIAHKRQGTHLSNVNGIVVPNGTHINFILKHLVTALRPKITKTLGEKNLTFSTACIKDNVTIILNCQIGDPSWTGQRKDKLIVPESKIKHYTLPTQYLNNLAKVLVPLILDNIFDKSPTHSPAKKCDYDKYTPAKWAGTKKSSQCVLIPVEGDSAKNQVVSGIANSIGFEKYGVISLGGVIVNVRKETKSFKSASGLKVRQTNKLAKNIFINAFISITGLNTNLTYENPAEISKLHYGHIAVCVDQDTDGKGNILGLFLNMFEMLWPNLLASGYVKWFSTPIIRAYPTTGKIVKTFYSTTDYETWATANTPDKYDIRYYKGIGTHSREETITMFRNFESNLRHFTTDPNTRNRFETYFGDNPALRKTELALPLRHLDPQTIQTQRKSICCSDHLDIETKAYQLENLGRKLDNTIDGQNESGRKILNGILQQCRQSNKPIRVSQLAGIISSSQNYHHGEDSLVKSITKKAFITPGGRQLPFLVPLSYFGSRLCGGKKAASARYIKTILNKRLTDILFPDEDYWLLDFTLDEGKRAEPKYFVPIVPLVVLESSKIPSTGWLLNMWARDVTAVINYVKSLILSLPLTPLPICTYRGSNYEWKGTIRLIDKTYHSFGLYTYDPKNNSITITELPLRVWTLSYIQKLKTKLTTGDIIKSIEDSSSDMLVNIKINLQPSALEKLTAVHDNQQHAIETYFLLGLKLQTHINLISENGAATSYASYEATISEWFTIRQKFFTLRLDRNEILEKLHIIRLENVIRYVENSSSYKLPGIKLAEMERKLSAENYQTIHHSRLISPKFTPTPNLETVILSGPKANYSYLLDMSDSRKSQENLLKYKSQLVDHHSRLKIILENKSTTPPGAKIWLESLAQLQEVVTFGQSTMWLYEEFGKYTF